MSSPDVIVVGAGISGLALAWKAAQAGKQALVIERRARVGGCIYSRRTDDGFWFEMGAHTVYNSYGAFLDIAAGTGVTDRVLPRGPARAQFGLLQNGEIKWLTPPKVLWQLGWLEAALRFPFGMLRSKRGQSIASHYSRLIGPKNFARVLSPFFAAVPSQSADGFPVHGPGSLFKKRVRRKEFMRSFGFEGGLQTLCDAAARADGVTVETGVGVSQVSPSAGGVTVQTEDGRSLEAPRVAVAAPVHVAKGVLAGDFPEVAAALERIATVEVDSMGVVLPQEKCWMPPCAFVVPVDDLFFSAVTRDPFPDDTRRAFAFHFRPDLPREQRLARMAEVLRVDVADLTDVTENHVVLPSPAVGHDEIIGAVDAALAGKPLALCGNYFAGLAIEDCVLRSNDEWARVSGES